MEPSVYQEQILNAFKKNVEKNILVEAYAGTGKTSTIMMLVKNSASRDLYVAFNKSIQMEMKEKLTGYDHTKCYTMHALGLQIISYNLKEKYDVKPEIESNKNRTYIRSICKEKYDGSKKFKNKKDYNEYIRYLTKNYLSLYDLLRVKCISISDKNTYLQHDIKYIIEELGLFRIRSDFFPPDIEEITSFILRINDHSMSIFHTNHVCDFTDMLYLPYLYLSQKIWSVPGWLRFQNIYFDECQDASMVQLKLVRMFKKYNGRFVFVGDPNQAIYAFSGADARAWNTIPKMFDNPDKYDLPINYRCDKAILSAVNEEFDIPIQPGPNALDGNVEMVSKEDMLSNVKDGDFILSRFNKDLIAASLDLMKLGRRVTMVDQDCIKRVCDKIESLECLTVKEVKKYCVDTNKIYERIIKENGEDSIDMLDLETNSNMLLFAQRYLTEYKGNNAKQDLVLWIKRMYDRDDTQNAVRLMSIHKSKGLEADNVYVMHQGKAHVNLAHSANMAQQEINLSYVAYTRARKNLYLVGE